MKLVRLDEDFADWQGLLSLVVDAFAFMNGRIDPPSSALALTIPLLRAKAMTEIAYTIIDEGRLLACVFCKPEPDCVYIGKLAVAPSCQGEGLGRSLLNAAMTCARERGLSRLRLQTRIELSENHAVFSAWGFAKIGEYSHPGYDRITFIEMSKAL
ncbi:GNAT family N-acetyltransferase [Pararhizobium antarcticum]|uniref:Acetyltransferase n=1 Tax=Pararhizobium antarcticum TaxID=1798805 RepID=A0A657LRD8_9HYPH|nr:GNAT family N-acetyltransferase [Pararhizobium antarcticum]OJF93611.1 acetyltransferase [Rhizobium sp. 58]OJF94990.1 acetyltransferase [Pararhizobium antarcticum]